ncbi:hypothetical protein ACLBYG_22515 [Methylobacterium sp. D53M]
MATTVIDTAGWLVVVPLKPALNLAGSHLTTTVADRFGGAVVALDSTVVVPGYGGARQIDWTADANGLSDRLVLTITRAMRGDWLAAATNGLPTPVTLYADVKRTVAGSTRDPETLGRTSFAVIPATDSPAVAAARGSFQAVLGSASQILPVAGSALVVGPQGPGFPLPAFDPIADEGKTFGMRVVNGALVWVVLGGAGATVVALSGAIPGSGLIGGNLSRIAAAALAGSLPGLGGPTGGLTIVNAGVAALAGALAGGGGPTGALGVVGPVALSGAVAAGAGPVGSLGLARALAGALGADGLAPGALTVAIPLVGALQGSGGPGGALAVAIPLTGGLPGGGGPTGVLSMGTALTGAVPGSGALAGALSVAVAMAGALPSAAGPAGALTVLAATVLAGAIPAPLGPRGALTVAPGLVNARKGRLMAALAA